MLLTCFVLIVVSRAWIYCIERMYLNFLGVQSRGVKLFAELDQMFGSFGKNVVASGPSPEIINEILFRLL